VLEPLVITTVAGGAGGMYPDNAVRVISIIQPRINSSVGNERKPNRVAELKVPPHQKLRCAPNSSARQVQRKFAREGSG
jgi:hypothetical protein